MGSAETIKRLDAELAMVLSNGSTDRRGAPGGALPPPVLSAFQPIAAAIVSSNIPQYHPSVSRDISRADSEGDHGRTSRERARRGHGMR